MSGQPLDPPGARHRTGGDTATIGPASDAPSPSSFINCMRDDFVQVRRADGTLLGCIPQFGDNIERVYTRDGASCDVATGIVRGVIVPDTVDPREIAGFVAREGVKLDPPVKADGTVDGSVVA
jgi:hypothetical protein